MHSADNYLGRCAAFDRVLNKVLGLDLYNQITFLIHFFSLFELTHRDFGSVSFLPPTISQGIDMACGDGYIQSTDVTTGLTGTPSTVSGELG